MSTDSYPMSYFFLGQFKSTYGFNLKRGANYIYFGPLIFAGNLYQLLDGIFLNSLSDSQIYKLCKLNSLQSICSGNYLIKSGQPKYQ